MNDVTSGSVSKGVFVFKGKKTATNPAKYFCDGHASDKKRERMAVCEELLERISERIQTLQCDLNTRIFDELLKFIQAAHVNPVPSDKAVVREIPTAALITGVNMPDHNVMFGNLASQLMDHVTPHVAVLRSKDSSTIKSIMAKTLSQIMQNNDIRIDDEIEEGHSSMKRISNTLSVLTSWYQEATKRGSSPRKRKSDGSPSSKMAAARGWPPIVIVMEDLEGFPAHVLQDFVTICSNHLNELPLVLVFGIATTVTTVHRLLPNAVSSLLCMEKFQAPPSSDYLTTVINRIVMTPDFPFKLGPKVFNFLVDMFLYHDFSVVNFIRGMQFALLEHFSEASSLLCQPLSDVKQLLITFDHAQVEQIRAKMSFRRYVENRPPKEQISLLEDDNHTKKFIMQCLARLDHYHDCYFPMLQCLHSFTCRLPRYPLGKQIREMYGINLASNICDVDDYKEALALLRSLSRDELASALQQGIACLQREDQPEDLNNVQTKLQALLDRFHNIEELSQQHESQQVSSDAEDTETKPLPGKMDMFSLKQKLLDSKKKKLSYYELLRNETVDFIDSMVKKYLVSPQMFPLHDVLYYNSALDLKKQINGCPRATIQRGFSNSFYYLQHPNLKSECGTINPTLPDICIVYKLHLECGRFINLYDWLQAFITVVHAGEDEENLGDQKKPDKVLQARFIRAVSELQFLGFIKPTKRKTDHVARLTWGGC